MAALCLPSLFMQDYKLHYTQEFTNLLKSSGGTLLISVYQAGKLILLNVDDSGVMKITPISYKKPMGLAINGDQLAIATFDEAHIYTTSERLAKKFNFGGKFFDKLYFPRATYYTGPLDLHDISFVDGELWAVNTRFSCICSFDYEYNFTPRWTPHFISERLPEDRCHLNGMALENGKPAFATALGSGDTKQSWRENITDGGILMSIPDNEIIYKGLSMPHSPRVLGNDIFLLESAKGEFVRIDRTTLKKETVVKLNGLVRGISYVGNTAFIGISKVREKSSTFQKLDDHVKAEHAAIYAVDLVSGMIYGVLEFKSVIEEIYDIQFLPNCNTVGILGLYDDRYKNGLSTPDHVFWKKNAGEKKESSKSQ